jgi:hypothetical protein
MIQFLGLRWGGISSVTDVKLSHCEPVPCIMERNLSAPNAMGIP